MLLLRGHAGAVRALAYSPRSSYLVSGDSRGAVKLWDVAAAKEAAGLLRDAVRAVVFSPGGETAYARLGGDELYRVKLEPACEWLPVAEVKLDQQAKASAFAPNGMLLAEAVDRRELWGHRIDVYEVGPWQQRPPLTCGFGSAPTLLAFSRDGGMLAMTGEHDTRVLTWALASGRSPIVLRPGGETSALCYSPDGRTLASVLDSRVRIWDALHGGKERTTLKQEVLISTLHYMPDGTALLTGNEDGTVRSWDLATERETWALQLGSSPIRSLAISFDGMTAAAGHEDGSIMVWDLCDL